MKQFLLFLVIWQLPFITANAQKKYSLEGKKISKLVIIHDQAVSVSPGNAVPLGIVAHTSKGDSLFTEGMLAGKTLWKDFSVTVDGGSFENGFLKIADDVRTIKNHKVVVKAASAYDASVFTELELNVDYKKNYTLDLSGAAGEDGSNGANGADGYHAADKRSGDGDFGKNGKDGQQGRNGRDGLNGPSLSAWITAYDDSVLNEKMLRIKVLNETNNKEYYYLLPAETNILNVVANGGNGGKGGNGGNGGFGGKGGNGGYQSATENVENGRGGDSGNGGNGGNGGTGGNGGNAGTLKLYIDPSAAGYAGNLRFTAKAGKPGAKGIAGKQGKPGQSGQGGLGPGRQGTYGQNGQDGSEGVVGLTGAPPIILNVPVKADW